MSLLVLGRGRPGAGLLRPVLQQKGPGPGRLRRAAARLRRRHVRPGVADDLLLLFIFWELTTILSYLLIGFARTRRPPGGPPCRL